MSIWRCDICDRTVDTDEDVEGRYDEVQGVFSCSRCCAFWDALNGFEHALSQCPKED